MRIPWHPLGLTAVAIAMFVGVNPSDAHAQAGRGYVTAGPALVRGFGYHDFAVQAGVGGEIGTGVVGLGGGFDYIYFTEANETFDNGRGSGVVSGRRHTWLIAQAFGLPRARQARPAHATIPPGGDHIPDGKGGATADVRRRRGGLVGQSQSRPPS